MILKVQNTYFATNCSKTNIPKNKNNSYLNSVPAIDLISFKNVYNYSPEMKILIGKTIEDIEKLFAKLNRTTPLRVYDSLIEMIKNDGEFCYRFKVVRRFFDYKTTDTTTLYKDGIGQSHTYYKKRAKSSSKNRDEIFPITEYTIKEINERISKIEAREEKKASKKVEAKSD